MKFYAVGDKVRMEDGRIATVIEATKGQYTLPEGQAIGGAESDQGGEAYYTVRTDDGEEWEVQDREVYNPTKEQLAAAPVKKTAPTPAKRRR